jgi:cobalamin synthase
MGAQATGDPLMVMADPSMGVQATGVQQLIHLARSSIPAWLPDGLTETMSAASAKTSAIRHRYCCCRERAPIPNSNCLAFPDVRQNCSVDPSGAIP